MPGKIEKVLCLGNITDRETLHYLQSLSREFLAVKGEFDDPVIYQHVKTEDSNGFRQQQQQSLQDIGVGSLSGSTSIGGGFAAVSGANSNGVPGGVPKSSAAYMSNAPDGASLNTYASVSSGGSNDGLAVKVVQKPATTAKTTVMSVSLPLSRVVTLGELRIGFNSGHTIVPNSDPDALLIAARQLDVDIFIWGGTHRVEAYKLEGKFFVNPGSATGAFYTGWPDPEEEDDEEEDEEGEREGEREEEDNKEEEKEEKDEGKEDDDKAKEGEEEGKSNDEKKSKDGEEKQSVKVVEPKDPIPSFCLLDIQGTVCIVYIYRYIDGEVKVDKINYRRDE